MPGAPKVSLVVGSAGQDGYYLSALLRSRGDEVLGLSRAGCTSSSRGALETVDITEREQVARLLTRERPAEVYYLPAVHGASESGTLDSYETFLRSEAVHVRAEFEPDRVAVTQHHLVERLVLTGGPLRVLDPAPRGASFQ